MTGTINDPDVRLETEAETLRAQIRVAYLQAKSLGAAAELVAAKLREALKDARLIGCH